MSFFAFITLLTEALSTWPPRPKAFADNPVLVFAYGALCLVALIAALLVVLAMVARLLAV